MAEGYLGSASGRGGRGIHSRGVLDGEGAKKAATGLLMGLYERPLPVVRAGSGQTAGLVTFYGHKAFFYGILYLPSNWRRFADISMDLLRGDGTSFLRAVEPGSGGYGSAESGTAALCTDAVQAAKLFHFILEGVCA